MAIKQNERIASEGHALQIVFPRGRRVMSAEICEAATKVAREAD